MTYSFQVWTGKMWETKFMSTNPKELQDIKEGLEDVGFRVIVVGDGYLPKRSNSLEETILKALLEV